LISGTSKEVSPIFSFVLPGSQYVTLGEKRALIYAFSEVFIGTMYGIYSYKERSLFYASRVFAYERSGAILPSHYDSNWRLVEAYLSYDDYVTYLYRVARQIYPDEPEKQDQYVKERLPKIRWKWESVDAYMAFQDYLKSYRELQGKRTLTVGLLILNHLASGVDHIVSKEVRKRTKLDIELKSEIMPDGLSFACFFKY